MEIIERQGRLEAGHQGCLSHVGKETNRMYSEVADLLQSMKKTMEKSGVFSIKISGPHIQ